MWVYRCATSPTAPSSVAEKNSVCRWFTATLDDPVNRRAEPHVEHPVGLVEDQELDLRKRERAAGDQVLQAPGCGDQDVRAACLTRLLDQPCAAVDRGDAQRASVGDRTNVLDDLLGQLPRGRQDQRRGPGAVAGDPVDQRDPEGQRLAGPGGGFGEHVATGENIADHQALYCEWFVDPAVSKRADDDIGHAEIGEGLR